ncbi:hypothetical protein HDU67_006783 [Dinochytrium kinnereticum]|nr:hypothetical protein HDU67_006783 [Dinochytrium kinnereticum]
MRRNMDSLTTSRETRKDSLAKKSRGETRLRSGEFINTIQRPSSSTSSRPTPPTFSIKVSDRPLYCLTTIPLPPRSDLPQSMIITGGADHGLTAIQLDGTNPSVAVHCFGGGGGGGRSTPRWLGHREWVTCLSPPLPTTTPGEIRIASGAMDSRVCLWTLKPTPHRQPQPVHFPTVIARPDNTWKVSSCLDMDGHEGSVTSIHALSTSQPLLLLTSSYDGSLKTWRPPHPISTLPLSRVPFENGWIPRRSDEFRRTAVMGVDVCETGTMAWRKDGRICMVDVGTARIVDEVQAHRGAVTAARVIERNLVVSAGLLDGSVRCFDLRVKPAMGRCVGRVDGVHGRGGGVTFFEKCGDGRFETLGGWGDGALVEIEVGCRKEMVRVLDRVQLRQSPDGTSSPPPKLIPYALKPLQGGRTAVAWGDGTVTIVRRGSEGRGRMLQGDFSEMRWVEELAATGVCNALRGLGVLEMMDGEVVVGVGDDGVVVGWGI